MNDLTLTETSKNLTTFTPDQVELLKRTVAKGTTNDELQLFLHVCQRAGLDPFAKQIYAIKRKNRRSNLDEMTIQTGIDGYRVVAERTNRYAPGREPAYHYDEQKNLISATATVNKLVGEKWFEISATAFFKEYVQENNFMWGKMPHVMLAKCAEALALRKAFPNELSGLYTTEEMAQADTSSVVKMPERKDAPKAEIAAASGITESLPSDSTSEVGTPEPDIPFGGEPPAKEGEEHLPFSGRKINRSQQQLLFIKAREAGIADPQIRKALGVLYGYTSTSQLNNEQFEKMLDLIRRGGIRGQEENASPELEGTEF